MKEYLNILIKCRLFSGIKEEELLSVLKCLNYRVKHYNKNAVIFSDGNLVDFIGIVLSGEIQTQKIDYNGNANMIAKLYPSDCIAVSACYSTDKRLPFDTVCVSECEVLCLDIARFTEPCGNACHFHNTLIKNALSIVADKNIMLAQKIDILTKRNIREKILTYLLSQSKQAKSAKFSVPLTRAQMAEYLSINRSALSRELSHLQNENIISFEKNSFLLKS